MKLFLIITRIIYKQQTRSFKSIYCGFHYLFSAPNLQTICPISSESTIERFFTLTCKVLEQKHNLLVVEVLGHHIGVVAQPAQAIDERRHGCV